MSLILPKHRAGGYPTLKRCGLAVLMVGMAVLLSACQTSSRYEPVEMIGDADRSLDWSSDGSRSSRWSSGSRSRKTVRLSPDSAYPDIWSRMRDGYQLSNIRKSDSRIRQQIRFYTRSPAALERTTYRSEPYIHFIVEQLEAEGMPLELALLPLVESAYNPLAKSSAQAVGLWQFIPSTGRHFKLRQTSWYDGRRDVIASTKAAIRYLKYLHGMFDDWPLALAAYNYGEGNVSKAISRNRSRGLPTDYWSLRLPKETRYYVPRLLALAEIFENPARHKVVLAPIDDAPYFRRVAINNRLKLDQVADNLGLDRDEIYRLNPAFTRKVTADGPRHLLVPVDKAPMLASLEGTTLPPMANAPRAIRASARRATRASTLAASGRVYQAGTRRHLGGIYFTPNSKSRQASAASDSQTHRVQRGETLWSIAANYNISVQDLKRWNRLKGSSLQAGQVLSLAAR